MNRKIIFIIAIIAVLVIIYLVFFLKLNHGGVPIPSITPTITVPYPSQTYPSFTPGAGKIILKTTKGDVEANNFYDYAVPLGAGGFSVAQTGDYYINYFSKDNSFQIALNSKPANLSRQRAERAFLQLLGINQADACKLTVSLAVPYDIDPNLAGKDYHLSFCPNGTQF